MAQVQVSVATQLKADLSIIGNTIDRADIPAPVKMLFKEFVAWNESLVEQTDSLDRRVDIAEEVLDELTSDNVEGISPETSELLATAIGHSQLLCQAAFALIDSPVVNTDEVSKKRFVQLIENAQRSLAIAAQTVSELTLEDGEDDGHDGSGRGNDGDAPDDEGGDDGEEASGETAGEDR